MHYGKKKVNSNSPNSYEAPKQKERHIVSWSLEEDSLLREQIRIHGTANWTIIASNFKDKSTRQCRRRWYTYLNSDVKKGGWSPEEDMLLCEAQKIFGNRWTEIAKVVSGRTDNAVKNRFSTLCKKRAKDEALAKENNASHINLNNKGTVFQNGLYTDSIPEPLSPSTKMRRMHIFDKTENFSNGVRLLSQCGTENLQLRPPLTELVQNFEKVDDLQTQHHVNTKDAGNDVGNHKKKGTFMKKGDPKIFALLQQAELLSSLALKVNSDNTDESRENAWKVVQDFLNQTKESDALRFKILNMDFQLENFEDLVKDLKSSSEGNQPSWREPDLHEESQGSSEYSTGSTLRSHSAGDKTKQSQAELSQDLGAKFQSTHVGDQYGSGERDATTNQDILTSCDDTKTNDGGVFSSTSAEFSSPLQLTPLFRSLAAGIPTPKFSESERHYLLKTLGMELSSPGPSTNPSQPPPCKRALLHSL